MNRKKIWSLALLVPGCLIIFSYQNCGKRGSDTISEASTNAACRNATVLGSWNSIDSPAPADTLQFSANCRGSSSHCGSEFIYPDTISTTVDIRILSTNANAGCAPSGNHTCNVAQYQPSANVKRMTVNCGFGTRTYQKQ